jgi:predicted amidohydrolase YtcJ
MAAQLALCRQLGVNVSFTIGHVFFWGEVFNNLILPPDVAKNVDPTASLLAAGVPFSFHSDSPISPIEPLRYIQTGATRTWQPRPGITTQVLGPAELISVDQAIKAVTINAAHAGKMETRVGSLEVGKYTDLVILGANPRTVPPTQIADITVLGTIVNGTVVSGNL